MGKRPRLDDEAKQVIADAKVVLEDLEALYGSMPEESLYDTRLIQTLIQPTVYYTEESSREYRYIGRARAKDLLETMLGLEPPRGLLIEGAKGSGKSTAVCSATGYLLGKRKRKVVYICAGRFINDPVYVLRHALLVATGCDETVSGLTDMQQLTSWCSAHRKDPLLFVVDDYDKFDDITDEQELNDKRALMKAAFHHVLVRMSSTNNRERALFQASDKALPAFSFDGPYTPDELKTWVAQSCLSEAKLQALECLTGGMPLLLRFYEEVKGNQERFKSKVDDTYTRKLFEKVIGLQTTEEQLGSVIQMVTTGARGIHLKEPVDLTCFYKEGNKLMLLSPYLRTRAEYYIMEQNAALKSALSYAHIQKWAAAVRFDCGSKGRNPARACWNVEGLVIALMRYQGKLWKDGFPFQHYKTYEHGCEAVVLESLTSEQLCEGVLLGPVALSEKALDVVYLKLDSDPDDHSDKGILMIKVVQITIAKWKDKGSYKVWQEVVLRSWISRGWSVEHQVICVLPEKVDCCKDLGPIQEDAAQNGSGDTSFVTERVDLAEVKSQGLLFKKLGDVHRSLEEFDKLLNLAEPEMLKKMTVKHCPGVLGTARPCRKWCRTDSENWCCCEAHRLNFLLTLME